MLPPQSENHSSTKKGPPQGEPFFICGKARQAFFSIRFPGFFALSLTHDHPKFPYTHTPADPDPRGNRSVCFRGEPIRDSVGRDPVCDPVCKPRTGSRPTAPKSGAPTPEPETTGSTTASNPKPAAGAIPRMLYRMIFVKPVLDTTSNGQVLDETKQLAPFTGKTIGEITIDRKQRVRSRRQMARTNGQQNTHADT